MAYKLTKKQKKFVPVYLFRRRSNSDLNSALSFSYKFDEKIHHLKIRLINSEWYANLENQEGEQIDCVKNNIEDLIEEIKKYLNFIT